MNIKKSVKLILLFLVIFYSDNRTFNSEKKTDCTGCAIQNGEIPTIGGVVVSGKYFAVRQDCFVAIPGFMIIASKRHVQSIDEFTKEERLEFIELTCSIRKKMRDLLSIETVYMIQKEDATHFHLWMFPNIVTTPGNSHFVFPEKDLVLAVVNTPPFNPNRYISITETDKTVGFDKDQFDKLKEKHESIY